jgi:hypothetical protein
MRCRFDLHKLNKEEEKMMLLLGLWITGIIDLSRDLFTGG